MRIHPLLLAIILGNNIPAISGSERESFNDAVDLLSSSLYVRRRDGIVDRRSLQGLEGGGGGAAAACPDGADSLQINIKFDSYPEDLELELTNDGTKFPVWTRNDATHKYTAADQQSTVTTSACLPSNECWRLNVFDTKGDGYVAPTIA
jgi:hypothetical protein